MTALIKSQGHEIQSFDKKQLDLLRDTLCKGATHEEFQLFAHVCNKTGLDPFMKQVYPVKRWDAKLQRECMTIQTSIDGYRLIADRTGRYAPGKEPTFSYKQDGKLLAATAYVKKQTSDGSWHEIAATAFYDEYCQKFQNKKTGESIPTKFWLDMPHSQTAKCAEALALRKAFPAEMSGIYTKEEMEQSEPIEADCDVMVASPAAVIEKATAAEEKELMAIVNQCSEKFREDFHTFMTTNKKHKWGNLAKSFYENLKASAVEDKRQFEQSKEVVHIRGDEAELQEAILDE